MLNIFKTKNAETPKHLVEIKLCRSPAYKTYEDFQDGQMETEYWYPSCLGVLRLGQDVIVLFLLRSYL